VTRNVFAITYLAHARVEGAKSADAGPGRSISAAAAARARDTCEARRTIRVEGAEPHAIAPPGEEHVIAVEAPRGERASHLGNLILPLVILAVCGLLYFLSSSFPEQEDVGAAAVPHLWISFTTVFCVALAVQALRRKGDADPVPGRVAAVLVYALWMVLYLLAIEAVGYYVSTLVFLVGSMYLMSYRRPVVAVSVACGWLLFSYVVFAELLYIPLPVGPLLAPLLG